LLPYLACTLPLAVAQTSWQVGQASANGAHVLELNLLELQRLDDDVEIGHCEGSARDLKDVCAEIGDLLFDVDVCPCTIVMTVMSVATPSSVPASLARRAACARARR